MSLDLPPGATGALALADGTVFAGVGLGRVGEAVGEVCFNTAMTGYQEILTDPSYMAQIVTFTFPHIGNVGTNLEDIEQGPGSGAAAVGAVFRDLPTPAANWRAHSDLCAWLERRGLVALAGIDTRALTRRIRQGGMPHGVIAHAPDGRLDVAGLLERARAWPGLKGADLALPASCTQAYPWREGLWSWPQGYAEGPLAGRRVVVVDYGVKRNILRALASAGAAVEVVPAQTSAEAILARAPAGVVLANGPGDPAATAAHAAPTIRALIEADMPLLGVCLGHQLLALALGGRTVKMEQGHHGANHPVKDLATGKVEIVSMNHGFAVDRESLPPSLVETHLSLFDGSNCGLAVKGGRAISVQHHPEASPGPSDALGVFSRFAQMMAEA